MSRPVLKSGYVSERYFLLRCQLRVWTFPSQTQCVNHISATTEAYAGYGEGQYAEVSSKWTHWFVVRLGLFRAFTIRKNNAIVNTNTLLLTFNSVVTPQNTHNVLLNYSS